MNAEEKEDEMGNNRVGREKPAMKRREFVIALARMGGGVTLAPAFLTLTSLATPGCSSGSSSGGSSVSFDVNSASGHFHRFEIPQSRLDAPPADGYSGSTTSTDGHTHVISLTQSELVDISDSMAVGGSTSSAAGHLHTFSFSL